MFKRGRTMIAIPPGATIKELIEDRGMTQKELASRLGLSEGHVRELIDGHVQLTRDVAGRLEMVLGLSARFWLDLEAIYRTKLRAIEAEDVEPRHNLLVTCL
ncbi:MAG: HigA family addiction module antidote protein [Synergistaceae bacterium]|nr:HigA family addiction module antidote protein [Synergistaceae bacterium]